MLLGLWVSVSLSGICPNSKSINTYSIVLHLFKFHLLDYTGPVYSQYEQATSNYSGIKKIYLKFTIESITQFIRHKPQQNHAEQKADNDDNWHYQYYSRGKNVTKK